VVAFSLVIRLVYTTVCEDLDALDFMVRTECVAFERDRRIDGVWVVDATTGAVLARIVDRAREGDPKNDPRAIAKRIIRAQQEQARNLLFTRLGRT
jgi:hypothetical protein